MKRIKKFCSEKYNQLFVLLFIIPQCSYAANGNKLVAVFEHVNNFLTSTLARGVGITAIASIGYLHLFQNKIDKTKALTIVAAIGIILGAPTLYDTLAA